jgi:hypothetical protein
MAQRVPFIVAELGRDPNPFMLHLYAALAEKERRLSQSERRLHWRSRRRRAYALAIRQTSRMPATADDLLRRPLLTNMLEAYCPCSGPSRRKGAQSSARLSSDLSCGVALDKP